MVRNVRTTSKSKRRKAMGCRAWLNGREVTNDCFYADSRRGVVRMFVRREDGYLAIKDGALERVERHGHVVIRDSK